MCALIDWGNGGCVADIKQKYVRNIAESAKTCGNIDRIVLFGSATQARCTAASDIDIAVFGKKPVNSYLRSPEFKRFHRNVVSFENDFSQDYDILYFCVNDPADAPILRDIAHGTEVYRRYLY